VDDRQTSAGPPVRLRTVGEVAGWFVEASSSKGTKRWGPYTSAREAWRLLLKLRRHYKSQGREVR
jgi:hypothetical protein